MLKKVLIFFVAIILGLFAYAGFQPAPYVISRETLIKAPADQIFTHLNSNKLAEKWGPWLEVDPAAKMSYSGPDAGVGSKGSWTGGKQLGTGSATIVESVPNKSVKIALEYSEPMVMTQTSYYLLETQGAQTKVTWKVEGKNTFMGRVMCIFFNMDRAVGSMFEKGLSNLKKLVESGKT